MRRLRGILVVGMITGAAGLASGAEDVRKDDPPTARIDVTLTAGTAPTATGAFPGASSLRALREALPGVVVTGVRTDGVGDTALWASGIEALGVVAPRLDEATVTISDDRFAIDGIVSEGFSVKDTTAALRTSLGTGWSRDIVLGEPPLPATVMVARGADGTVTLDGLLPRGIDAGTAAALVDADEITLSGGGSGAVSDWLPALRYAGLAARAYAPGSVTVIEGRITADGAFGPGFDKDRLAEELAAFVPKGWRTGIDGTPGPDTGSRIDLVTGWPEARVADRWLPQPSITANLAECSAALTQITTAAGLTFVEGVAEISRGAARTLDRIAGVARHCISAGGLHLTISGHTDDVGRATDNLALSERRARSVRSALIARDVPAAALTAIGFGEEAPVADNATREGRARNRRIALDWQAAEG